MIHQKIRQIGHVFILMGLSHVLYDRVPSLNQLRWVHIYPHKGRYFRASGLSPHIVLHAWG